MMAYNELKFAFMSGKECKVGNFGARHFFLVVCAFNFVFMKIKLFLRS